jgi:hypothetical protein
MYKFELLSRKKMIIFALLAFSVPIPVIAALPLLKEQYGDKVVTPRIGEAAQNEHLAVVGFFLGSACVVVSQAIGWAALFVAGIWRYITGALMMVFCFLSLFAVLWLAIFGSAFFIGFFR